MIIWGSVSEFLVDLNGNGKLWLFIDNWYNPVFITINGNGLTIIHQLICFIAPIVYYLVILNDISENWYFLYCEKHFWGEMFKDTTFELLGHHHELNQKNCVSDFYVEN